MYTDISSDLYALDRQAYFPVIHTNKPIHILSPESRDVPARKNPHTDIDKKIDAARETFDQTITGVLPTDVGKLTGIVYKIIQYLIIFTAIMTFVLFIVLYLMFIIIVVALTSIKK